MSREETKRTLKDEDIFTTNYKLVAEVVEFKATQIACRTQNRCSEMRVSNSIILIKLAVNQGASFLNIAQ